MALAEQITGAKATPEGPQRDANLLTLRDLVAVAMDPARSVTAPVGPAVRLVGRPSVRSGGGR